MTRRYPDSLPSPSAPGYTHQPVDQTRRTQMEAGAQRVRLTSTVQMRRVGLAFRMEDAEKYNFDLWYHDRPCSICGASDEISGWGVAGLVVNNNSQVGPDGVTTASIDETATTGFHAITLPLPGAAVSGAAVWVVASVLPIYGRSKMHLRLVDRAGTFLSVAFDCAAMQVTNAGASAASIEPLSGGWVRVTAVFPTGYGGLPPELGIAILNDAGEANYTGVNGLAIGLGQIQARLASGYDLFVPANANGRALGAGSGAAWFGMQLPFGGGLRPAECRFTGPPQDRAREGLIWDLTAEVEARNA